MTNPNPTAAPETCGNCRFYRVPNCHRYPKGLSRPSGKWCGEWSAKAAPVDDRAPTPTPVAVSETPVGERQRPYRSPYEEAFSRCLMEAGYSHTTEGNSCNALSFRAGAEQFRKECEVMRDALIEDPEAAPRAILAAYNAEHLDAPMTYWPGGEKAPEDCTAPGEVLFRDGTVDRGMPKGRFWGHVGFDFDIIGYRAKAKQPEPRPTPEEHAAGAFDPECPDCRYMEAEQPVPVDPVVLALRDCRPWDTAQNWNCESLAARLTDALAKRGLRLVRDLSEKERRELADSVSDTEENITTYRCVRNAIDAVLGPVK